MCVTAAGSQECPLLTCNAEEADTRVWLHVVHSVGTKKLLISPDTDVYHIGLPLCNYDECVVYVQVSVLTSPNIRLLHLNKLHNDLRADPGLALVPIDLRDRIVQTLFICGGCDYVSKFMGFGKVGIMKFFLRIHGLCVVLMIFPAHWLTPSHVLRRMGSSHLSDWLVACISRNIFHYLLPLLLENCLRPWKRVISPQFNTIGSSLNL